MIAVPVVACSLMILIPMNAVWMQLIWIAYTLFHIEEYLQMIADVYRSLQVIAVACIIGVWLELLFTARNSIPLQVRIYFQIQGWTFLEILVQSVSFAENYR